MNESYADAIYRRLGDRCNVLGYDWNAATFVGLTRRSNAENANRHGLRLAAALRTAGVDPTRTQLIGFSYGTNVVASAAYSLWTDGRGPVAQLTLLDPLDEQHVQIFEQLGAFYTARRVENYWTSGPSGYGAPAAYPGVINQKISGPTPCLGKVVLTRSDHMFVPAWYFKTIQDPDCGTGFNNSFVLEVADQPSRGIAAAAGTNAS